MAGTNTKRILHPVQLQDRPDFHTNHFSSEEPKMPDSTTNPKPPKNKSYWKPLVATEPVTIQVRSQIILEQSTVPESKLHLQYGTIDNWELSNFHRNPTFYTSLISAAVTKILQSEPYKWMTNIIQFYPTNVRIEYQNAKQRKTIIRPCYLTEEALTMGGESYAEDPALDNSWDTPVAHVIIRLGLVPTQEQVTILEEAWEKIAISSTTNMSTIEEPEDDYQPQTRYLEVKPKNKLPSSDRVRKTYAMPRIRDMEEKRQSINEMIAQETRIMMKDFIIQMDKTTKEEQDGDIRMRQYIILVNNLIRRYNIIDERSPRVMITDNRTLLIQPRMGKQHPKVFYLGEPQWNQQQYDKVSTLYN